MGVRVRIREVPVYRMLKMQGFIREISGTAVAWCRLMGGVRLWEVSAYGRCPLMGGVR